MPVASNLQQLRGSVVAAVDRCFAEPVELLFLRKGTADPDRENVAVQAVLRTGADASPDYEGGSAIRSDFSAGRSEARIDRSRYQGPPIRKDDKLRAISRPGRPFFVVNAVNDRDATRLILTLTEA